MPVGQGEDARDVDPVDADGDGARSDEDCNDQDPAIAPGSTEVCNGIDDDCDGEVDEDLFFSAWADGDGDGWGGTEAIVCALPTGFVKAGGDCDDDDPSVHPAAAETCDGRGADEDCDGLVDEADDSVVDAMTWYVDADGDGYGDPKRPVTTCAGGEGLAPIGADCDDTDPDVVPEAIVLYEDLDGDGYGTEDDTIVFPCGGWPSGYAELADDCDDTEPTVHPEHFEDCRDGMDNNCDGAVDDCGPLDPIDVAGADQLLVGAYDNDRAGDRVASAGDIDGDGNGDILVSAPGHGDRGATFLLFGPVTGDPLLGLSPGVIEISSPDVALAAGASGAGDVDRDLYGDFWVGSYNGAYLFHGPVAGDLDASAADVVIDPASSSNSLGWAMDVLDLNDDGHVDHLIADPLSYAGAKGSVHVVLGPVTSGRLDVGEAHIELHGDKSFDGFGEGVASLGDVDGDGFHDFAGGAVWAEGGAGVVYVVHGVGGTPTGAFSAKVAAEATLIGPNSSNTGRAVSRLQDQNGDGVDDLLIGAPRYNDYDGAVYVVDGTVTGTHAIEDVALAYMVAPEQWQLGQSVDGTGDVNGDGLGDLLLGAPDHSSVEDEAGVAFIYYGPVSGSLAPEDARLRVDGTTEEHGLGGSVAFVPDMDGDRRDDVLIGVAGWLGPDEPKGAAALIGGDRM